MASVEPLSVGDRTLQAQRLQLVLGGAIHEFWLDGQNRVLRVEIPSEDYVATRLAPPKRGLSRIEKQLFPGHPEFVEGDDGGAPHTAGIDLFDVDAHASPRIRSERRR